jgi:hypothetical protein
MANAISIKVNDSKMKAAIRRLSAVSSKLPSELVNQKAYRIAQKAVWYSPAVSKETIATELNAAVELVKEKSGKRFSRSQKGKVIFGNLGNEAKDDANNTVPLLALIIQARAKKKGGKPSPWKGVNRQEGARRMLEAMRKVYGARQKSRAYFKACFATIRDIFQSASKGRLPFSNPSSRGSGTVASMARDRGRIADGTPASVGGFRKAIAQFWIVSPRHDLKAAIYKHAQPALQRAFDEEAGDTWKHALETEYKNACKIAGIRTN